MPAILCYLADKYSWGELYPRELRLRSKVNQYLHAHHCLTRLATLKLMAPHVLVVFGGIPSQNPLSYVNNSNIAQVMHADNPLEEGRRIVNPVLEFIDDEYLGGHDFVAGSPEATIADIACYEELAQLEAANLMRFDDFPGLAAWVERIKQLPWHDPVHVYNQKLGDIVTEENTLARFGHAIEAGLAAIAKIPGVKIVS